MVSSAFDPTWAALSIYPADKVTPKEGSVPHNIYVAMDLLVTNIFLPFRQTCQQAAGSPSTSLRAFSSAKG